MKVDISIDCIAYSNILTLAFSSSRVWMGSSFVILQVTADSLHMSLSHICYAVASTYRPWSLLTKLHDIFIFSEPEGTLLFS
jgi:hypothetical protein